MEIKAERIEDKKLKKQKTKERNKKLFFLLKKHKRATNNRVYCCYIPCCLRPYKPLYNRRNIR